MPKRRTPAKRDAPPFPARLLDARPRPRDDAAHATLHDGTVWTSAGFLSDAECDAFVAHADAAADLKRVCHPATRDIAHRECNVLDVRDPAMARRLFARMEERGVLDIIRAESDDWAGGGYVLVGCNENFSVLRYDKGHSFGKHVDVSNAVDEGQTEVTVLIYLSECEGGATVFHIPSRKKKVVAFNPVRGAVLFHAHGDRCLEHEGEEILRGTKYVLRTDLVYARETRDPMRGGRQRSAAGR